MAVGVINQEFLSHNANRRYPLADDASGVDGSASFSLPNDFLVGASLPVHSGLDVNPAGFFLKSVSAFAGGYGVVIAYQPADEDADPVTVATALIPRQGFTGNQVFTLGGVGDFSDTVGYVVIGRLENIDDQPPGVWTFTPDAGRLDPDVVRPIIRGVTSITCVNAGQESAPIYGDVQLVAENNMQILPIIVDGQDPIIRFSAISGEGTVETCVCTGDEAPAEPIKTIQGIAPTPDGNFLVIGSACVQVEPIDGGIRIRDVCSQPCCGPKELEKITQDLSRLGQQATAVQGFVDRLQNATDTMSLVVLGSRIGDRNCVSDS